VEQRLRELSERDRWWSATEVRWRHLREIEEVEERIQELGIRIERWESVWRGLESDGETQ